MTIDRELMREKWNASMRPARPEVDEMSDRSKTLEMAKQAGFITGTEAHISELLRFAALVRAEVMREMADSGHSTARAGEASTAPLPDRPFAIVIGRGYDGDDSLELAVHDGVNYCMSDGDCFDRDGDTLDGYTAEFLTQYELEKRLDAAHRRSLAGDQKPNVQEESAAPLPVRLLTGKEQ